MVWWSAGFALTIFLMVTLHVCGLIPFFMGIFCEKLNQNLL